MELDKNIEYKLAELIANPEKVSPGHVAMLNELLQEYPYYQPLHLLLAKAAQDTADADILARAALYSNGKTLHRFLFELKSSPAAIEEPAEEVLLTEAPAISDEQETFEEITEDILPAAAQNSEATAEEDVFEEIAEVDYTNYRPFSNAATAEVSNPEEKPDRRNSLEDNFVFESIVSSDFFAFENNFSTEKAEEEVKPEVAPPPFIEEHDEAAAAEVENGRISNYHDDKLPYTFLWWLAKTRKEHQTIFQPYAQPKKEHSQELQQQYVEHIFHMQTHLTGNEALLEHPEPEKPASRDFEIIESFIKNDPQITPPNAEQIDNENKAKKSAEDQNDLVSETLANIYIEQMLYDKAIETYEKLSLKFPEKSRYFADLIQSIEKKI